MVENILLHVEYEDEPAYSCEGTCASHDCYPGNIALKYCIFSAIKPFRAYELVTHEPNHINLT